MGDIIIFFNRKELVLSIIAEYFYLHICSHIMHMRKACTKPVFHFYLIVWHCKPY